MNDRFFDQTLKAKLEAFVDTSPVDEIALAEVLMLADQISPGNAGTGFWGNGGNWLSGLLSVMVLGGAMWWMTSSGEKQAPPLEDAYKQELVISPIEGYGFPTSTSYFGICLSWPILTACNPMDYLLKHPLPIRCPFKGAIGLLAKPLEGFFLAKGMFSAPKGTFPVFACGISTSGMRCGGPVAIEGIVPVLMEEEIGEKQAAPLHKIAPPKPKYSPNPHTLAMENMDVLTRDSTEQGPERPRSMLKSISRIIAKQPLVALASIQRTSPPLVEVAFPSQPKNQLPPPAFIYRQADFPIFLPDRRRYGVHVHARGFYRSPIRCKK